MDQSKKDKLIEDLLHEPLKFNAYNGVEHLVKEGITFREVRELVRRIYDLSETQLREASNANTGIAGILNKKSTKKRTKKYYRKVCRQKKKVSYYKIYAEGDSWFQFPVFIRDIIDWLGREKKFLIYSEAYGGDWITNIIYESQYIPSISVHAPDYFLISGGGNDLVGNNRLAMMVERDTDYKKYNSISEINSPVLSDSQKEMILMAQPFIRRDFYAFLNVMKLQYTLIFEVLYRPESKHKHIITLTHGYDYPFPNRRANCSLRNPLQPVVNKLLGSGKWLYRPMMIKDILDISIQRAILLTFIYEFNETMCSFARSSNYPKVFHIDCRGVAPEKRQWYDELHLKSKHYKRIKEVYKEIIMNNGHYPDRVIRVAGFKKYT